MIDAAVRYDLVIVGASFAGLVAARTAAVRGLRVAVLETKPDAGARVATTGILVKEAAEEIDIPHDVTRRVHGVRLYSPNLKSIDLFAPGSFFLTTDTAALLRWLAREALRAGAHILFRTRFEGAERADGIFRFKGLNIEARYILGADGGRSTVARHFGLGRNRDFLVGLEAEYVGGNVDPRFLHCFLGRQVAPGYLAWVAPGPTMCQAGLAVRPPHAARLGAFIERVDPLFGFSAARIVERRAGRIPCGGLVYPWAGPGVMLVGDAAGMVSPLTGGGIRLAFQYGRRAAHAIGDHLQNLGPPPELALAGDMPRFAAKRVLRRIMDGPLPDWLVNWGLRTAVMRRIAQHVYFHRRGAAGMTFAEFEARLGDLAPHGMQRRSRSRSLSVC